MTTQLGLVVDTQVPAVHVFTAPQPTHAEPLWPQAVALVLVTQVLPLQQPLAQVVALQVVPPVHTPPAQAAPPEHAAQAAPLRPQMEADWPVVAMQELP